MARLAGVSTATVSRVISEVGYVAAPTRIKVQTAIDQLNYRPSLIAQSLRKRSTAVIGLIVSDIENPFYPELVRAIEDQVQKRGYSLILCNSADDPEREVNYLHYLASHRAEGVIISASGFLERNRKKSMAYQGHMILVNAEAADKDFPTVYSQGLKGGFAVGKHISECGYPKIIYIGSKHEARDGFPRYSGVKNGAGKIPVTYYESNDTLQSAASAVEEILKEHKPPFALVGHNDLAAIGAMHALLQKGINVPREVGVVGYDNIAMSAYVSPALTTVSQNQSQIGAEAISMLERLLRREKKVESICVPSELIVRSSTTKIK